MKKVLPELHKNAEILIVGEAPGAEEDAHGRPFVGDSGKMLFKALGKFGFKRTDFNITNVCQYRPPNNKIDAWLKKKSKGRVYVDEGTQELQQLVAETRPKTILAVGGVALSALHGVTGISFYNGSLLTLPESDSKLLPVLHPAAVARDAALTPLFMRALWRLGPYHRGEIAPPQYSHSLVGGVDELGELLHRLAESPATPVSVDIETDDIFCCGFSVDGYRNYCFQRRDYVQAILDTPNPKVLHNSLYDICWLEEHGYTVRGEVHDTMFMHRALRPEFPQTLAMLTQLYTYQPYYKLMGKTWKESEEGKLQLFEYNCLDVASTITVYHKLNEELLKHQLHSVYQGIRRMIPIAAKMSRRGIRYDTQEVANTRRLCVNKQRRCQRILNDLAGWEVNVNSPDQVKKLLYEQLRLPYPKVRRGGDGESSNGATAEKTLMGLYSAIPDPYARKVIKALIEVRRMRKFISSYLNARVSPQGRMRTSLNPGGTETGRWSSSKFLIVEGANLQTIPSAWKKCFIADEGMLLFEADYSQIEARFVAYDAGDLEMIRVFESGGDIHKDNARRLFGTPLDKVTDDERQVAKTCVHALNYDILPPELVRTVNKKALKTGQWLTLDQAKDVRNRYLSTFKQIVAWRQRIWEEVQRTRTLTNPFGRKRVFLGALDGPEGERTRKQAIAHRPQSTVPDMLNEAISRVDREAGDLEIELFLQVHDALKGQGRAETWQTWAPRLLELMNIPVQYKAGLCRVPVDLKIGPSWGKLQDYCPRCIGLGHKAKDCRV